MKEFIIDLRPKSGGPTTKVRLGAASSATAREAATKMYPDYYIGTITEVK